MKFSFHNVCLYRQYHFIALSCSAYMLLLFNIVYRQCHFKTLSSPAYLVFLLNIMHCLLFCGFQNQPFVLFSIPTGFVTLWFMWHRWAFLMSGTMESFHESRLKPTLDEMRRMCKRRKLCADEIKFWSTDDWKYVLLPQTWVFSLHKHSAYIKCGRTTVLTVFIR